MSVEIEQGKYHRMPIFFGPVCGPRQWPKETGFDPAATRVSRAAVRFRGRATQLEAFLPPRFTLWGEPVVTLDVTYMTQLAWLAGRGYAISDFKFPVVYHGEEESVSGTFVLVRWENLADPIITGREELGQSKLYCEIPDLRSIDGRHSTHLSWLGFTFAELELWDLAEATPPEPDPDNRGQLSFKYVPRTGSPGEADAAYVVLSPAPAPGRSAARVTSFKKGRGRFEYRAAKWEEFPFAYNVVSAIAGLEIGEILDATLTETSGADPYPGAGTRILA